MTGRGWSVDAWRQWGAAFALSHDGNFFEHGPETGLLRHVSTDTRTQTQPSKSIFFALVGPWHDGHDHLQEAYDAGIRRWVVGRIPQKSVRWTQDSDVLVVPDVILALQHLALTQRHTFHGPVLAVTGSNGKTTVKEWIASLLPERVAIHRSPLSHNSQLGVPLSVWSMDEHHDISLIEAGISMPGEMVKLRECICPTEGVLTHLGEAHVGNFENAEHLAREKCALFKDCSRVFLPESLRQACSEYLPSHIVTWSFAHEPNATDAALLVEMDSARRQASLRWNGKTADVTFPFANDVSVRNACTAILVALHHGSTLDDIQQKTPALSELTGRMSSVKRPRGGLLIQDDCNHDLGSLEVALQALERAPGNGSRVAIIGDVTQSGLAVQERIERIANLVGSVNLDEFWFWGPNWNPIETEALQRALCSASSHLAVHCFSELPALVSRANRLDKANVLVKVSSHAPVEAVIQALAPARHVTTLTMRTSNLIENVRILKSHVGATGVVAVIKGLGYGTDPVALGRLLEAQGVDWLAVAYADEGVALREAGIQSPIMVLNPDPITFETMHSNRLEPQLVSLKHVRMALAWAEAHEAIGWPIHLKLDTGMHRLGLAPFEDAEAAKLLRSPSLQLASVMSHLAGADDVTLDEATRAQVEQFFHRTSRHFKDVPRHILNSAGSARITAFLHESERQKWAAVLTHIRVGLGMYGLGQEVASLGLKPVLSLHTSVAKLVQVPSGEGSGYGLTDAATHDRTLAVLSVGYADGYPRSLGNGVGFVNWKGRHLPTVGRVCMDMVTVDATGLDLMPGDRVYLWGNSPSLDEVAQRAGTIPYELLTHIGPRVQRVIER